MVGSSSYTYISYLVNLVNGLFKQRCELTFNNNNNNNMSAFIHALWIADPSKRAKGQNNSCKSWRQVIVTKEYSSYHAE